MKVYKFIFFVFIFLVCGSEIVKGETQSDSVINLFKTFSYSYQPSLFDGNDTLAVPRLPRLDDQLNGLLYNIKGSNIDSIDDYAFLILAKLFYGQELITGFSYDMCSYAYKNVILDICLERIMSIDKTFIINECFDVTTWVIYTWASNHKFLFNDNELLSTLSIIDEYIENTYKEDK